MNRRNIFGMFGAGIASLLGRVETKPLQMSAVRLQGSKLMTLRLDDTEIKRVVSEAMTRVKVYLPDGSFSVACGLTNEDDADTIWTAGSTG